MTPQKSILLKTSAKSDVQYTDGAYVIGGTSIPKRFVKNVRQFKYRAEVAQVYTVGASLYTPTASTVYKVNIGSIDRRLNGVTGGLTPIAYKTPPVITTIGATPALQREFISLQLVAQVNALTSSLFITGASLTGGAGFTLTDKGGYYGPRTQGGPVVAGPNEVIMVTSADGTGFVAGDLTLTTPAVIQFGTGANLLGDIVVSDAMFGSYISGVPNGNAFWNPLAPVASDGSGAVSGQKYDAYVFDFYSKTELAAERNTTALGIQDNELWIFVDNGTGAATTNLAGYNAFDHEMHKILFDKQYWGESTVSEFFDKNFLIQGPLGAVPATTTSVTNKFITPYSLLNHVNVGTQTIVAPTQGSTGLLIDQDINTGDGAQYSPDLNTLNPQEYVVGTVPCMLVNKITWTAVTGANYLVGFRTKAAFQLDYNDYNDLAAIGIDATAGAFTTYGILANAATIKTVSATNAVNATLNNFMIKVEIDGTVTVTANGIVYPIYSAGTTPLVLAKGTIVVPFFEQTNITGTAAVGNISEFASVQSTKVIS